MTKSECRSATAAKLVIGHWSLIRNSSLVIRHLLSAIRHSPLAIRRSVFFLLAFALTTALGQESPTPSPSPILTPAPAPSAPPARSVHLRFALPPFDGTISLGIYNAAGKLVRVLHREDEVDDFTAGNDALETDWDGTDNEGKTLPSGKYHGRGFVVGGLKIEGVDYFFNDWVRDEASTHVRSLVGLLMDNGELQVRADPDDFGATVLVCNQDNGLVVREFKGSIAPHCAEVAAIANVSSPVDCAAGKDGTSWYIDRPQKDGPREVKQLDKNHEVLRRLSYTASEPQPEFIEASPNEERIFLIERSAESQRFRALTLVKTTKESPDESVSDWKTLFERNIVDHGNFGLEDGKLVANPTRPQPSLEKFTQKLRSDPLQNDKPGKVELAVGIDSDGSFLKTSDGLPLRTISDTPKLRRVLLSRPDEKTIDVFQDDGAVVEQFRISNLAEMIAFDCGDFELK